MEKRRVVITGAGAITPIGHTAAESWQAVRGGVCGVAISYALLAVAWAVTGLIAPAALPAGYAVLLIVADAALACLAGLAGAAPASRL